MKATSHHEHDEQRDDRDRNHEDRLMADGGTGEPRGPEGLDVELGARVLDRNADDPNLAVVVALPEEPAYAVHIDALDGSPSVADVNPDYPASAPVATVAYAGDLDRVLDVWRDADPEALAAICDDHGVRTYDFPILRLRPADEFVQGGDAE